jgi:ribosomal protein S12 methylthiotransferase accessory factor
LSELVPVINTSYEQQDALVQAPLRQNAASPQRICSPEETLRRIQPLLAPLHITRVADVTHLDNLGIPVMQAIRPNSRNLSVSQGKGSTKALATVSALMEAIELWHAEEPDISTIWERVGTMQPRLPYTLSDLELTNPHMLHDALPLEWFPASIIGTAEETFVPAEYIRLNFTMRQIWQLPMFHVTSNGLASGNTREEAILHGLYEVIERDVLAGARLGTCRSMRIDPTSVDGSASAPVLERFWQADATVGIYGLLHPTGIACFEVHLSSPSYPTVIKGSGCHLNRDIALSRALTEAAQVRLSVISGARDDIQPRAYTEIQQMYTATPINAQAGMGDFHGIVSVENADLFADLNGVLARLRTIGSCPPLVVDLTRSEFALPVVHVVIPNFRMVEGH